MVRHALFTLFALLMLCGCQTQYSDYFPFRDDGTQKPHVALLPVINGSKYSNGEKVCNDLTRDIRKDIMRHGTLFLFSDEETSAMMLRAKEPDYFSRDLSYAKDFSPAEYVVVVELIEHNIVPREAVKNAYMIQGPKAKYALAMKARMRVIDRRNNNPKVILQEIVEVNHIVPDAVATQYALQADGFDVPHDRLVDDVVDRLEGVIGSYR